jgi:hypothetical protein
MVYPAEVVKRLAEADSERVLPGNQHTYGVKPKRQPWRPSPNQKQDFSRVVKQINQTHDFRPNDATYFR